MYAAMVILAPCAKLADTLVVPVVRRILTVARPGLLATLVPMAVAAASQALL